MRALQILAAVILVTATGPAGAQNTMVFVRAEQDGQGVLRERNGECFVLTPAHVVGEPLEIVVVAAGRVQSGAYHEFSFDVDLAALRVKEKRFPCAFTWDEGRDLAALLDGATEGVLASRTAVGGEALRYVRVAGSDAHWIRIRPETKDDAILQTQSGSILRIGGRPAGMLLEVEDGVGRVLRLDYLSDLTRKFFDPPRGPTLLPAENYTIDALEFRALCVRSARVQEQPDQLAASRGRLSVGDVVAVTGRVKERLWYRVLMSDGTVGFVQTAALKRL